MSVFVEKQCSTYVNHNKLNAIQNLSGVNSSHKLQALKKQQWTENNLKLSDQRKILFPTLYRENVFYLGVSFNQRAIYIG